MSEQKLILDSRNAKKIESALIKDTIRYTCNIYREAPEGEKCNKDCAACNNINKWMPFDSNGGDVLDPAGVMMHKVFARLMEMVIERLNKAPEKHFFEFMEFAGVEPLMASPAIVPLTFIPSENKVVNVPKGSLAVCSNDENEINFETVEELTAVPMKISKMVTIDPVFNRYTFYPDGFTGDTEGVTPFFGNERLPGFIYVGCNGLRGVDTKKSAISLQVFNYSIEQYFKGLSSESLLGTEAVPALGLVKEEMQGTWLSVEIDRLKDITDFMGSMEYYRPNFEVSPLVKKKIADMACVLDSSKVLTNISDCAKSFYPFGENVNVNDIHLNISDSFFCKSAGRVALHIKVNDPNAYSDNVDTYWRIWSNGDWYELPYPNIYDEDWNPLISGGEDYKRVKRFEKSGIILLPDVDFQMDEFSGFPGKKPLLQVYYAGTYNSKPKIESLHTEIVGDGYVPAGLFYNSAVINPDDAIRPFGEQPQQYDTFYISCGDMISDNETIISMHVKVGSKIDSDTIDGRTVNMDNAAIVWERYSDGSWIEIKPDYYPGYNKVNSGYEALNRFKDDGKIVFPRTRYQSSEVNGISGVWLRARIDSGGYGSIEAIQVTKSQAISVTIDDQTIPVDIDEPAKEVTIGDDKIHISIGKQTIPFREGDQTDYKMTTIHPPVIKSLKLQYNFKIEPRIVCQKGFMLRDTEGQLDNALEIFPDQYPALYLALEFEQTIKQGTPVTFYIPSCIDKLKNNALWDQPVEDSEIVWEYFNGSVWSNLYAFDETNHLQQTGVVRFLMPGDLKSVKKFGTEANWVRVVKNVQSTTQADVNYNHPEYRRNYIMNTQRIQGLFINTVRASQIETAFDLILGSGNGEVSQTMDFPQTPVLGGQSVWVREGVQPSSRDWEDIIKDEGSDASEIVKDPYTGEEEIWIRWHEVSNFLASESNSRHYTLDHEKGTITFGDGTNGAILPAGVGNVKVSYKTSKGKSGNVPAGSIANLKSDISGIDAVTNMVPSVGGADAETPEDIKVRGPKTLRNRNYAVTAEDFEWLAMQACGMQAASVKCLLNTNKNFEVEKGKTALMILPNSTEDVPVLQAELVQKIDNYLKERAFAGISSTEDCKFSILVPDYLPVSTQVDIVPNNINDALKLKETVTGQLKDFFHPVSGGNSKKGWSFGRNIYMSDLCKVIEGIPGVKHIIRTASKLLPESMQYEISVKYGENIRRIQTAEPQSKWAIKDISGSKKAKIVKISENQYEAGKCRIHTAGFKAGDDLYLACDFTASLLGTHSLLFTNMGATVDIFPPGSMLLISIDNKEYSNFIYETIAYGNYAIVSVAEKMDCFQGSSRNVRVTVFYPKPLVVNSLGAYNSDNYTQTINIKPVNADTAFLKKVSSSFVITTLDNRNRFPYAANGGTQCDKEGKIISIAVRTFTFKERVIIEAGSNNDEKNIDTAISEGPLQLTDVVYMNKNTLPCSGKHVVNIISEIE